MSICKICFKEINQRSISNLLYPHLNMCQECFKQMNPQFINFKKDGISCLAIYQYDEMIKKYLYQLKGCYDIEIKDIFLERFIKELSLRYKGYILIPIPSWKEDDSIRGFNHVEEIFSSLNVPIYPLLYKKYKMKQSTLNAQERKNISKVFDIQKNLIIEGKKVLIIDDVYTTGSSFECAKRLIEKYHPKKIKGLFLAINRH